MLVDPLPVKTLNLSSASAITVVETNSFALVDLAPGKSVRRCAAIGGAMAGMQNAAATLTIAHSQSKENGAVPTDRSLIRLDLDGLSKSTAEKGGLKAFAYLVVGAPRGAMSVDGDDVFLPLQLVYTLLGTFAVSTTAATLSDANLSRILAGEP